LVQHPIDPFYLVIGLWVKCHIKKQLCSHLLEQKHLEAHQKLGVFIAYDELRHPIVLHPNIEEEFC